MVVRSLRFALLITPLASMLVAAPARADDAAILASGRALLEQGQLEAAQKIWTAISFGRPAWNEKAEDLIRYQLLNKDPVEAWRIVQVLRRTKSRIEALADYERLAVFEAGGCALELKGDDETRASLIDAATYRFHQSLFTEETSLGADPVEGSSLAPGLSPYLSDIPHTTLIKGQGCRLEKFKLKLAGSAERAELTALLKVIPSLGSSSPGAALLVLARAEGLAQKLGDKSLRDELNAKFPKESDVPWMTLPAEERRTFFMRYFQADAREVLPTERRAAAEKIALDVLSSIKEVRDVDWLAFVDVARLSARDRAALLSKVEKVGSFKGRAWVLMELARTRFELGEVSDSLTILRRLLLEREEAADEALEGAAVDLAARVYADHRFDQRLLGMMQAALPSRLWAQLLETTLVQFAVNGRSSDFKRAAEPLLKKISPSSVRAKEISFWRALSTRDERAFRASLTALTKISSSSRTLQALASRLVSEQMASPNAPGLEPFTRALASELRAQATRPGGDEAKDKNIELAALLETRGSWAEATASVRKGIIDVGTARWKEDALAEAKFKLRPANVRLRELIFKPDVATGRKWILSTSVR